MALLPAAPRAPGPSPYDLADRLRDQPRLLASATSRRRRRARARVPHDRGDGETRRSHGERQGQEPSAAEEVQRHGDEAQALGVLLQPAALRRSRRRPQQGDPLLRQHAAEVHLRRPALRHGDKEAARRLGEELVRVCNELGISEISYDRNGFARGDKKMTAFEVPDFRSHSMGSCQDRLCSLH
ncbi:hypothetical protein ZEAMMB73_Zm00001d048321 [Zea mays]|uniref:Uncharacterized protein n=1 Tax=Zea mays TaxID=4577 RepID=A0A1D6PJ94_MAIZE|nr:hypothetical protein ZEAMMB73_Zm00001d048321 [Zea mays]